MNFGIKVDKLSTSGYVIFYSMTSFSINPYLSVLIAVIVCTVLGIVIEKVAYKPLRQATSLSVLITGLKLIYVVYRLSVVKSSVVAVFDNNSLR